MKRSDSEILRDIRRVHSDLSPENLSWDGERKANEVVKARKALNAKLKDLIKELGREPTTDELYNRHREGNW